MADNIEDIGKHANNGTMSSPINKLRSAIEDIENGDISPDKILILSLNTENGSYIINWHQAGMRMSECITLCEISKAKFLAEMGYIPE